MEVKGLVGSALLISVTSISSPTYTTFNGDLQDKSPGLTDLYNGF